MVSVCISLAIFTISVVKGQSGLAGLPGIQQWQAHLAQHASVEGRRLPAHTEEIGVRQRSWDENIARVKEAEQRLREKNKLSQKPFSIPTEATIEIKHIDEAEESSDDGLRDKIKILIDKNLQHVRDNTNIKLAKAEVASEVEPREEQTFLDRLTELLSTDEEDQFLLDLSNENTNSEDSFDYIDNELEIFDNLEKERSLSIFDILSGGFVSNDLDIFDDIVEEYSTDLNEEDIHDFVHDYESQYDLENQDNDDLEKTFMEEELEATESEAELLANELASILIHLEGQQKEEEGKIKEAYRIIKSKLGKSSTDKLLQDEDFINSVFYRFALRRLPLRTEDVEVSEHAEINKLIHKNIATVTVETRNLLQELRQDILDGDKVDEEERAVRIDDAKRQLQKLLDIVQ